jgi:steroid 5-alpha reductase family enzyme
MSPLPLSNLQDVKSLFVYPRRLCAAATLTTYLLSIITGNVSQVDRVWTFLPTIYTAYWALLPLWPYNSAYWRYLLPYVPDEASHFARDFSPRALLMLALTVRTLAPVTPEITYADTLTKVLWMFRLSYNTWRRGLFRLCVLFSAGSSSFCSS